MSDSGGQPQGASGSGPETGAHSAMRRIREELDLLQESLSAKDVRLNERETQLNAAESRLQEKARELTTLNDLINQERQKLQAKEAEIRKQEGFVARARDLEEVLRNREASLVLREREMRRTLEALKRQAHDVEQQRRELRRSALWNHPAINMQSPSSPPMWRVPLVVVVAALLAVGVYVAIRPTYQVHAQWERTDGGHLTVDAVRGALAGAVARTKASTGRPAAIPTTAPAARWDVDKMTGRVSLEFATRAPVDAGLTLNTCGRASLSALERVNASGGSTADETARLTQRRDELRRNLKRAQVPNEPAATTAPSAGSVAALLTRVDELAASRRAVGAQLSDVRAKLAALATRPAEAGVDVAESRRSEAQAADAELMQARRRLKDQQDTIRSLLTDAFAGAEPAFGEARRAFDELSTTADSHRQNPPDAEAGGELDAIRDEAARAKDRLETLAKTWAAARTGLKTSSDPVAAQRAIEASVKEYVAASAAEIASLERRIQAIGEAGSQITKRLVVRAALTKSLRRVTEAHRALVARIDDVTAAANFRLEAAMHTAQGASETIAARVGVIDAGLQERSAARAKQERERRVDELRQEEQSLAGKAGELTDSLVPAQQALQELTRRWVDSLTQTSERQEAERRRNGLRDELAQVEERLQTIRETDAGAVIPVRFVPAIYSPQPTNEGTRIAWACLAALAALSIGAVLASPRLMAGLRSGAGGVAGVFVRKEAAAAESPGTGQPAEAQASQPTASTGGGSGEKS